MGETVDFSSLFRHADDVVGAAAGEHIFHEGDPADVMYVIESGEVSIQLNGREIDVVGPGSLVGELALVDDSPRSASAVAKTDCRLVPVSERRFLFLVQETPHFALQVLRLLAERIRRLDRVIGESGG